MSFAKIVSVAARLPFAGAASVCLLAAACNTEVAGAHGSTGSGTTAPRGARNAPLFARATRSAPLPAQVGFFGRPDEPIRRVLASAPIEKVSKGSGGRSLAFKLTFAGGVSAYFKPEQTFAANWYSEIASYYLDRELGFGRVPPAIGRRIEWRRLSPHCAGDERLEEVVVRRGVVRGSLVFWLSEPPLPVELPRGWESWLRIDPGPQLSPFRSPSAHRGKRPSGTASRSSPPLDPIRAAELSDLVVFDHLIGNLDRWSKDFTNVRTFGPEKRLLYLDNANGFAVRGGPSRLLGARLAAVQRFRKKTIDALKAFDRNAYERRLASDPLAPVLDAEQLAQLEARRLEVLEHVAALERRHGARALPW